MNNYLIKGGKVILPEGIDEKIDVLISDGKIDRYGLQRTGIDKKKLLNRLNRQNVMLSDVFLMLVDDAKNYTIILKEEKK